MSTDSIILIALAINFALAIVAYSVPRIRSRRARGAAAAGRSLLVTRARSAGDAADAGAAWFPAGRTAV